MTVDTERAGGDEAVSMLTKLRTLMRTGMASNLEQVLLFTSNELSVMPCWSQMMNIESWE